jgi:hypothetical protein
MTKTETLPRTCECGCGVTVSRRFLPGHDAKLKSRLLSETQDPRWWVRESAVLSMVERSWGHFVKAETLANTPVRSRHNGRLVESRHVDSLVGTVEDESGMSHSHWFCPERQGQGTWVKGQGEGWLCGTCTHTMDMTEMVGRRRMAL